MQSTDFQFQKRYTQSNNFFINFLTSKVFLILFTKKSLARCQHFINIYIVYKKLHFQDSKIYVWQSMYNQVLKFFIYILHIHSKKPYRMDFCLYSFFKSFSSTKRFCIVFMLVFVVFLFIFIIFFRFCFTTFSIITISCILF